MVPLPFSPRERAVVSHTFATRDLLDALQTFPMYRALVLRGRASGSSKGEENG